MGSAVDRVVPTPVKTLGSILASGGDPALSLLTPQTLAVTNNAEN